MMSAMGKRREGPAGSLEKEIEELRAELDEARETLRAIRSGEVDALVVSTAEGDRVFTLRGAETPYRVIVENISEGAATLLPDGVILYANAAFSNIVKAPLERIIGTRFDSFVWKPDRSALPDLFEKALQEIARKEIGLTAGDGTLLPVYMSLSSLPIDAERKGISMVITDISERRRAEDELRRAHDELDARVNQRTRELKEANRQLQAEITDRKRAVEDLERSNRELQQFAYVASHDLQEPLRTVSSFMELLEMGYKGKLGKEADTYISFAADGAKRMSRLINDLLLYSRVGTRGKSFSTVDMNSVVHQTVENLKTSIEENHAEVTHEHLPEVQGDDIQLVQLLQNLIVNAIKFRKKEEPPRIHIFSAPDSEGQRRFCVSDNGIGIESRFYDRIFAIFQRLHTHEEYSGTGVGLAICKKIVERHGGRIWVESERGKGSSFCFTLLEPA